MFDADKVDQARSFTGDVQRMDDVLGGHDLAQIPGDGARS